MLIGAVVNERPDLFRAAVGVVPFLDVLGTMVDSSLSLTTAEWEEWGNPNERDFFDYMRSYSPVHNVRAQAYPDLLLLPAYNDARTGYWEAFKWAQGVRSCNTHPDTAALVLMDMDMGHFTDGSRHSIAHARALQLAFILDKLGLGRVKPSPM